MPGANDGGSGVALLLGVADVLKRHPSNVGVDLLFVDGEDFGDFTKTPADVLMGSRYYAAHQVPGPQPLFLNAAAVGHTSMRARDVLDALLAIERERGRERPQANAPRTLDLDLILFGDLVLSEADLIVPHPRFRERRFVLEPLTEIAPGLVDPVTRKTVIQLLIDL